MVQKIDLARKDVSNKLTFGSDRKNARIVPFGRKRLYIPEIYL